MTSLRLHFRCLKPPCSTLATFSRLPDQTSPNGQPSDRIDFTELVDNPNEEYGEYTSLDSKLDHYPTSPHEPTYKSSRAPLSSLLPPPPTANHSSQRTFLNHSRRTGLNPASTVFTGTRYEYLTLSSLRRLGLELAKVGGTGDRGVDLVGFWHLPQWNHSSAQGTAVKESRIEAPQGGGEKINVLVQCKRISPAARATKSIGPNVLRELEGAFRGAPAGWRGKDGVLGILVSTRSATKGVVEGMRRSERALAWVLLEEVEESDEAAAEVVTEKDSEDDAEARQSSDDEDGENIGEEEKETSTTAGYKMIKGRIKQILWNQKARELGLEGLDVVKRYSSDGVHDEGDEVILMWQGQAVEGLPGDDD